MVNVNAILSGLVVLLSATAASAKPAPHPAEPEHAVAVAKRDLIRSCFASAIECTYPGGRCASDCEKDNSGCRCLSNYQPLGGQLQQAACITVLEYTRRSSCPWYGIVSK